MRPLLLIALLALVLGQESVEPSLEDADAGDDPGSRRSITYFPPPESRGGWRKLDDPDSIRRLAGMDPDRLNELRAWLRQSDERNFAAVVIRRGYVVLEEERGNSAATDSRRVASCSKAICATVLAIASEQSRQGRTPRRMSFDDRAFDFIPWAKPLSDPRKAAITVKQLLNHTSGICPEATGAPNDGTWEYILGHSGDARTARLAFDPGTACGYSTHALAHAALVCEVVTGKPYDEFAIEALFRPLGIEHWSFQSYDGGPAKYGRHPSHGLGMPAREMARIAYCMAHGGRWDGRQVIPEWFVEQTAAPTHDVHGPELRFKVNAQVFSHGWELPARLTGEGGRSGRGIPADARSKPGSGGQLVAFVPSLDLVVTRQTGGSGRWDYEEYLRRACAAVVDAAESNRARTRNVLDFRHHFASLDLPSNRGQGDYGLTALADLDRDGDLDFVCGGRIPRPERLYWFEYRGPDDWVRHDVGTNYQSDVGLAALDVDGDGWLDLVCSGVWYRNPGKPREAAFERIPFAEAAAGAHDILVADVDRDNRADVLMMGDSRTALNALCWFGIPADPRRPWVRHEIGPGIHGAITPAGAFDVDGDSDLDVARGDTWYENRDGKGLDWQPHRNLPMGRTGPYGVCVRSAVADLDGDGSPELVVADADITESKVAVLWNQGGKGADWRKQELPQSFRYGSLHALAVADVSGDGRPDIVVNEQEELLPARRDNPRWVVWENLGEGRFAERIVLDKRLGGHELQVGDVDGDGDVDIVSKPWSASPGNGAGGKIHVDYLENRLKP